MNTSKSLSLEKGLFKKSNKNSAFMKNLGSLAALFLLMMFFSMMNSNFIAFSNLMTITQQTSIFAILAIAETFIIITSGIDLSVGSVLAVSGVVTGKLLTVGTPIPLAVLAGLATGALCGLLSGVIIAKLDIAPFIATLGMMSIARGAAYVITGAMPVAGLPEAFYFIGGGKVGGVPVPTIIVIVLAVIFAFVLKKTSFGRYVYTLGSNEEAAKLSGVNVEKVKMGVYALSGFLAALVGIIMASRLVSAQSNAGIGYELDAIAAAIIGGTSPLGGVGTISGTIIGALIMGVIRNGLNIIGVNAFWQQIAIGTIIVLAVLVDKIRRK